MSEALTVSKYASKIKVTKEHLGVLLPWEVKSYQEDLLAAETVGGLFDLSPWATLCLEGKDTFDYLQRMTTVNFKTLPVGGVSYGAFLTGKGTLVSFGIFIKQESKVLYFVSPNQKEEAFEHIEKFHFGEAFETKDISDTSALFAFYRPRNEILSELRLTEIKEGTLEWRRWRNLSLEIWKDVARKDFFFLHIERKAASLFLDTCEKSAIPLLGHRAYEHLRIRHSVPEKGLEITDKEIILESGFDTAVHRNKGCYPGQEVVERIFTYGSVNRKLMPVEVTFSVPPESLSLPLELATDGKRAGSLVSFTLDPRNSQKGWALAYLQKELWDRDQAFKLPGIEVYYRKVN